MAGYIHVGVFINISVDGWSYLDSIYYWIVTFTTVGFGDKLQEIRIQGLMLPYRLFGKICTLLGQCVEGRLRPCSNINFIVFLSPIHL